jgi:nucleoid-associated protein YgaU
VIESPTDVVERAAELTGRFTAATAELGTTPADGQVENLRSVLDGVVTDVRDLVRDLDLVDELDFLLVDEGARTIQVWAWRRTARRALVLFGGQARAAKAIADELTTGQKRRVIVTREGETLQRIAQRELGDWREWPRILAANPTLDPGALSSGVSLVIPEKR